MDQFVVRYDPKCQDPVVLHKIIRNLLKQLRPKVCEAIREYFGENFEFIVDAENVSDAQRKQQGYPTFLKAIRRLAPGAVSSAAECIRNEGTRNAKVKVKNVKKFKAFMKEHGHKYVRRQRYEWLD